MPDMSAVVSIARQGSIAIVTIDNPPVNATSHSVRAGLVEAVGSTDKDPNFDAVVLVCTGRTFIAGADIREFGSVVAEPYLPDVVLALEAATKPWVAAIHGTALGGGLEIALGCHYRVAKTTAKLGLPEVNLGLIPGAGGTVRLPRCIPMQNAIDMITTGKPVTAFVAKSSGLIDDLVEGDLQSHAIEFANRVAKDPLPSPLTTRPVIEPVSSSDLEYQHAKIKKKAKGQLSPVIALETVRDNAKLPHKEGLAVERGNFHGLQFGSQSKALRHIFFAERATAKLPELSNAKAHNLAKVGVIGGGTMGAGITVACLLNGIAATMAEISNEASAAGRERVENTLSQSVQRGVISKNVHTEILSRYSTATNYDALKDADLIIEAVFEDMDVKKSVFKKLDAATGPETILASNTSYLNVTEIASVVKNPSRVLGLHFFSPAHIMKLVEVIKTEHVSDDVLATGFALAKTLSKLPVLSGDCDGFIGNRIMSAYRKEADELVELGAMPDQVDIAMRNFGLPMGVFEMQDLAGLDISWAMRQRRAASQDPSDQKTNVADRLYELGRLGRKTGSGWYTYEVDQPFIDDVVRTLLDQDRKSKGVEPKSFSEDEIMDRILHAMQREGAQVLQEGVAQSYDDIDVVMTSGYGFPRWRGGPMFMAKADNNNSVSNG